MTAQITFREWHSVGVEEYGYIAVDPLDPNIHLRRQASRATDQAPAKSPNVAPEPVRRGKYRLLTHPPVVFSPADPHVLFFAAQCTVQDD